MNTPTHPGEPTPQRLNTPSTPPSEVPIHPSRALDLSGRTAVVTGAGSVGHGIGIGRAIAMLLAAAGARVALLDVDLDAARETQAAINAIGGDAISVQADMAEDGSVAAAATAVADAFARVDILVNNVGIVGPAGEAETLDLDAWDRGLRINLTSMVISARRFVPLMKSGGDGSIVNIGSIAGMGGGYPSLFYPTSKGAIVNLTRTMAGQYGEHGIRVNCIAPGQVLTPRIEARGLSPEMRAARNSVSALGTEGTGWDPAYAALFLASPMSSWISGTLLPVDGGLTALLPLSSPPTR
ncbi:SDR family NAD(P)-dependent oxidoreductase [Gulosibacter sp. 10]|uniref:SDR family NAD(P)-dependent oxidoreductase n=1 Tax=Gulosibacter sp. 10 TaxID=1255570 RepID=UPI00097F4DEC|nr:SDR family oxidoreductase [Gulosibacter sp. 10]SJM51124.1 3-oxoacyl-[acyl-carrier protein] reductase [Gulosibacter sp. 10]